jgi:predicted lipoprotein
MKKISLFLLLFVAVLSCKPPKDSCATNFDQAAFLVNVSNNIITPRYDSLKLQVDQLQTEVNNFISGPNQSNLDAARAAYKNAAMIWQRSMIFEFGPAETHQLRATLNNFPVFVNRLESAVTTNSYNLQIDSFSFTRGYPAIDYLLFGAAATDNDLINLYSTDQNANNRKQFLSDVVNQIKIKTDLVVNEWSNYKNSFIANTGVATGSSVSLLLNQLNQNYELFKNNKLGTPVGAKVSYIPSPEKVEGFYSGYSLDFTLASLYGMQELFEGKSGSGFDDYLASTGVKKNGVNLDQLIISQFNLISTSLEAFKPGNLYDAIVNNFNDAKVAFGHSQNNVVYLKTDLASVLCVSITYVDNTDDGD